MAEKQMISRADAVADVRLMARRTALLHYYFAKTLVEELGEEEGKRLIAKVIWAYGEHCGRAVRAAVEAQGLPLTDENFKKIPDLPKLGWEASTVALENGEQRPVVTYCPLAAVWQDLGAEELGRMYCYVDQAKYHAYNPDMAFSHTKNVLDGDDCCEFWLRQAKGQ